MPRFQLRTCLVAMLVLALWCASSQINPEMANSVRSTIRFGWFSLVILSVYFHRGERQAFWLGAAVVVATVSLPTDWIINELFTPQVSGFLIPFAVLPDWSSLSDFLAETVMFAAFVVLGVLNGGLAVFIYRSAGSTSELSR